ncbi:hypothetical protein ACFL43_04120 [Thermodesulfobacteriota bacterium]
MKYPKRIITSIEDLSSEEQTELLKDIYTKNIFKVSLESLKPYAKTMEDRYEWNIDLSKIKKKDLENIHTISPEVLMTILLNDPTTLLNLFGILNAKAIYAKAYEAFVVDKKEMDMCFDEFRARCKTEYESIIEGDEECQP